MSAKAKIILVAVLLALLAILIAQNDRIVDFRIFFWTISISQVLLVPMVALTGFLAGVLVGTLIRRGRRQREYL